MRWTAEERDIIFLAAGKEESGFERQDVVGWAVIQIEELGYIRTREAVRKAIQHELSRRRKGE